MFCTTNNRTRQKRQHRKLLSIDPEDVPACFEANDELVNARIVRVIDGYTVEVLFLHGGKVPTKIKIRVQGVNIPKLRSKRKIERKAARHVKEEVEKELSKQKVVEVVFYRWDKYGGRVLGDIQMNDGYLSDYLLVNCYGQFYEGRKKIPFSDEDLERMFF
uniref:Thermonuclease/nuclease n=1 Tax=Pithovirus LCPAC304 TaxID=2506594 RepID=A0A481Z8H9_9VIRU|nr:MAG: thermonuclease/nuclease [Pithovirus LCPAC304]